MNLLTVNRDVGHTFVCAHRLIGMYVVNNSLFWICLNANPINIHAFRLAVVLLFPC